MLTGLKDIDRCVIQLLSISDVLSLDKIQNKQIRELCSCEIFWENRYILTYGEKSSLFKKSDRTWKQYFLMCKHYYEKYNVDRALKKVSSRGYEDLVRFFICKRACIGEALGCAARGGHTEIVHLIINAGAANSCVGLLQSARGGHIQLVELFLSKGARDWDLAMSYAAEGGHTWLVNYFVDKGCDFWDWGIQGAASGGHMDLVKFFLDKAGGSFNDIKTYSFAIRNALYKRRNVYKKQSIKYRNHYDVATYLMQEREKARIKMLTKMGKKFSVTIRRNGRKITIMRPKNKNRYIL